LSGRRTSETADGSSDLTDEGSLEQDDDTNEVGPEEQLREEQLEQPGKP